MLSFFGLMHFPSRSCPKLKGLFDCLFSENKIDLLQLFCGIPVKIGKMFINSYIFINFVLFSSGKTKFSMASCVFLISQYYLDCVEFYLSHVLTKFLMVGRALCTKSQSHKYYLDCVKSISEL